MFSLREKKIRLKGQIRTVTSHLGKYTTIVYKSIKLLFCDGFCYLTNRQATFSVSKKPNKIRIQTTCLFFPPFHF